MKKLIISSVFLLLLMSTSQWSFAQYQTSTLYCGKNSTFTKTYSSPQCYPKADYASIHLARFQFYLDLETLLTCKNDRCLNPSLFECKPSIDILNIEGDLEDTGTQYCSSATVSFKWLCTDCTRITSQEGDTEQDSTNEEGHLHGKETLDFRSIDHHSQDRMNPSIARVEKVYPNPSTGALNIDIVVEQADSDILILLTDISGKVVQRKAYTQVPQSHFHAQTDLANQANGLYFLSTQVNGIVIGTEKISLQK